MRYTATTPDFYQREKKYALLVPNCFLALLTIMIKNLKLKYLQMVKQAATRKKTATRNITKAQKRLDEFIRGDFRSKVSALL